MPNFTYTRDIPFSSHNPSVDQPDMQINNNSIQDIIAVDHYGFNDGDNFSGYHKIIHEPPQGIWDPVTRTGNPAAIAGLQETFALSYTPDYTNAVTDTQLFSMTGGGGLSQLTGSSSTTDGWQWIGGVLIQWGKVPPPAATGGNVSSGTAIGAVVFRDRGPVNTGIPFPQACFSIVATPIFTAIATSTRASVISIQTPFQNTGFTWALTGDQTSFVGFTWIAIGW